MIVFQIMNSLGLFDPRQETFDVMLAHNYLDSNRKPIQDPVGWYMSEKFDGERAIWDGKHLRSRNNNKIQIPSWFRAYLEQVPHKLDGELFMGYGKFHQTGIFRSSSVDLDMWERVSYKVFDIPDAKMSHPLHERLEILHASIQKLTVINSAEDRQPYHSHRSHIEVVEHIKIKSRSHLEEFYQGILRAGGEGVILANPYALYENKRSKSLLKYKPVYDSEAVVVGYKPGNGKFTGFLGSFLVQPLEEGQIQPRRQFNLSGMTLEIRKNYKRTHPLGTIITYAYRNLTATGIPLHPSYKGKRGFYNLDPLPNLPNSLTKENLQTISVSPSDSTISETPDGPEASDVFPIPQKSTLKTVLSEILSTEKKRIIVSYRSPRADQC